MNIEAYINDVINDIDDPNHLDPEHIFQNKENYIKFSKNIQQKLNEKLTKDSINKSEFQKELLMYSMPKMNISPKTMHKLFPDKETYNNFINKLKETMDLNKTSNISNIMKEHYNKSPEFKKMTDEFMNKHISNPIFKEMEKHIQETQKKDIDNHINEMKKKHIENYIKKVQNKDISGSNVQKKVNSHQDLGSKSSNKQSKDDNSILDYIINTTINDISNGAKTDYDKIFNNIDNFNDLDNIENIFKDETEYSKFEEKMLKMLEEKMNNLDDKTLTSKTQKYMENNKENPIIKEYLEDVNKELDKIKKIDKELDKEINKKLDKIKK